MIQCLSSGLVWRVEGAQTSCGGDTGRFLNSQLAAFWSVEVRTMCLSFHFPLGVRFRQLTGSWKGPGGTSKAADLESTKAEHRLSPC